MYKKIYPVKSCKKAYAIDSGPGPLQAAQAELEGTINRAIKGMYVVNFEKPYLHVLCKL